MQKIILLFCLLLILISGDAQVNLNRGLIGYYPFSGNSKDESGNNINGIVTKAALTIDRYGKAGSAYYFNGASYISLPFSRLYNFGPHDSFSISLWVMPESSKEPAQALVVKSAFASDHSTAQWNYGLYMVDKRGMTGYADSHILQSNTVLTNQSWYNITATYADGVWKLYINCVLEKQDQSKTNFILKDGYSGICFGKKGEANGDWFKGKMDEVRIYNRVLSAEEILTLCEYDPVIDFSYNITNCNNAVFKVSRSENVKNFRWNINNKQTANKESVTQLFVKEGSYTAKLIATGSNGKEITVTKSFTITKPNAVFSSEAAAESNSIKFIIPDKQKLKYTWLFGDGETSHKEKNIVHTYANEGNYNVTLIAENKAGCTDTAIQTITIKAPAKPTKDTFITAVITNQPDTINRLPEQRQNTLLKEIEVTSDSLAVSFYDNAEIDGDSVTIVYNNKIITTHLFLTDKAKTFMLAVEKNNRSNELIMYAENLGSIPPNTALMIVYDGNKRHEISISSSKSSNGMVSFIFKR